MHIQVVIDGRHTGAVCIDHHWVLQIGDVENHRLVDTVEFVIEVEIVAILAQPALVGEAQVRVGCA